MEKYCKLTHSTIRFHEKFNTSIPGIDMVSFRTTIKYELKHKRYVAFYEFRLNEQGNYVNIPSDFMEYSDNLFITRELCDKAEKYLHNTLDYTCYYDNMVRK